MLKKFTLIAAFSFTSILFLAKIAFSRQIIVDLQYPLVRSLNTENPFCYMQTGDGRTFNLSSLCEKTRNSDRAFISDVRYDGNQMIGHIVNQTGKTIHNVRVKYEVFGEDGNVIDTGTVDTNQEQISPKQIAYFDAFIPSKTLIQSGQNVRAISVEWDE